MASVAGLNAFISRSPPASAPMAHRLAAGILFDGQGILLVRREESLGKGMGLWSLPSVTLSGDAGAESALAEHFSHSLGLEVQVTRKLLGYESLTRVAEYFLVSNLDAASPCTADQQQEVACFPLGSLPESIAPDSLIPIIRYALARADWVGHPFSIIDPVLASVFHAHIAQQMDSGFLAGELELLKYIVSSTPLRKFKSVLPFLLSGADVEDRQVFVLPELCFAAWTLLDDMHDQTLYRYGQQGVLSRYGLRRATISLFTLLHDMQEILGRRFSPADVRSIISSLAKSSAVLLQRGRNDLHTDIELYLEQSAARTEFLRVAWKIALREAGGEAKKSDILWMVQEKSSKVGQLINDYFDIDRGQLKDFDEKIASAHWLLLHRHASATDRNFLDDVWAGRPCDRDSYRSLLCKYQIKERLQSVIESRLNEVMAFIQGSELQTWEKTVLRAWHQMSLVHFSSRPHEAKELSEFLDFMERFVFGDRP